MKNLRSLLAALFIMAAGLFALSFSSLEAHADHVHSYNSAVFNWNYDRSECTAAAVCTVCGETSYIACSVEIEAYIMPTCTERGTAKFTATADFGNGYVFREVIYQKDIPATGHSFTDYVDNGNGTMTAVCNHGCGQTDTITGTLQEAKEEVHEFTNASFEWNYDHSACRVTLTCKNGDAVVRRDALVSMDVNEWPTENQVGATLYHAQVTVDGRTFNDYVVQHDIPYTERTQAIGEALNFKTVQPGVSDQTETAPAAGENTVPAGTSESTEGTTAPSETTEAAEETVESADTTERAEETAESSEMTESTEEITEDPETSESTEGTSESTEAAENTASSETASETEETTEALETTKPSETVSSETGETEEHPESENAIGTRTWILLGVVAVLLIVIIVLVILLLMKRNQLKKHEDVKDQIHKELK